MITKKKTSTAGVPPATVEQPKAPKAPRSKPAAHSSSLPAPRSNTRSSYYGDK